MSIDLNNIKVVIWDLDNTFWDGVLSEDHIKEIPFNSKLVISLVEHGIMNTICSKNDKECAEEKLKELDVFQYFVFPSINWLPKGPRISQILKNMRLRPENCLFIDDNSINLREAKHYEPHLNVAGPEMTKEIELFLSINTPNDKFLSRLNNYKVLEKRYEAQQIITDNRDFLFQSNIQIIIGTNVAKQIDRIAELVSRTNQLNFTKLRETEDQLKKLLDDQSVEAGYVHVKDRYGDYGIVGFYAMKDCRLIHFLFSCRVIGLGIEQYVYSKLGYPTIHVVGDTAVALSNEPAPEWINRHQDLKMSCVALNNEKKILFKGNCDLEQLAFYLKRNNNVVEEFSYVGEHGNYVELSCHSVNYLSFPFLNEDEKQYLMKECIFSDRNMFSTRMYDRDIAFIFLSTMIEPNLGIYQNINNGLKVAFGEYSYPLTDSANWNDYISGTIFTSDNDFTKEWLQNFAQNWIFLGKETPEQILDNYKLLLEMISPETKVCFLLGSEIPYEKNTKINYLERHLIYKDINDRLRKFAKDNDRIILLDFNEWIRGQDDFTDNINHFTRRVYFEAAKRACELVDGFTDTNLKRENCFRIWRKSLVYRIAKTGLFESNLYKTIRPLFKKVT